MTDLVERLQKECDRHVIGYPGPRRNVAELLQQAKDELERLQKELETARRALEPFAKAVRQADEGAARMGFAPSFDEYEVGWNFSFGQLRRARDVYRALKDKEMADVR